jgi:TPR repeat protein
LVFPENSPRHPFITAVALVKDGDFQLIVGDPNIFYPIGESMFNGRLAGNHITGDWMDAPAHHGDGYRGYAWTKADIQIVDANNLAGPAGILLKRSSPEQGANRICDPTSFANIDAAHALNYANKDYELKNFGNAACWLYVSAVLGNSDAQLYMGVVLHFGTGVKTDMNQSFLWFKKAAFQDNLTAERAVAHCYGGGFGVSKDAALAKAWSTRIDGQVEVLRRDAAAQEKMDRNLAAWGILLGGGLSEHQTRVEDYQSRGMSRSSAEDAAKGDEADATFFHSLTHAYKPPPMPPPH